MFSSKKKIRIDKELYERLQEKADESGYSSIEEFVAHVLQQAAGQQEDQIDKDEVDRQLRGLGYIE